MASTSSSYLSVVRIGPTQDNVSATILKNAILDYFHKHQRKQQEQEQQDESLEPQTSEQAGQESPPSSDGSLTFSSDGRFQVSNRYFKAKLALKPLREEVASGATTRASGDNTKEKNSGEDKAAEEPATPTTTTTSDGLYPKEDGIILAFDAARSNPDLPMLSLASSFDSLDMVHEKATTTTKQQEQDPDAAAGELLRLCVGVTMGPMEPFELRGKEFEQEYSRRIMWCLDRGYEYVEADLSPAGLAAGHDLRDKEGFARIVEAIAGTVWSSAVMEKKQTQQLMESYQEETTALQQQQQQEQQEPSQQETQPANDSENAYVPPDPSLLAQPFDNRPNSPQTSATTSTTATPPDSATAGGESLLSDDERLEKAKQALLSEQSQADGDDAAAAATTAAGGGLTTGTQQEREQERAFDQLEGALKQAASIREMSQAGKLTDEERRQRAGDAALLLMNLMGGGAGGMMGDSSDEGDMVEDEEDDSDLE